MKDEIKIILEQLKIRNDLYNDRDESCIVPTEYYKSHILLDYITNLQEENEKLKELCDKYEEEHSSEFKIWKDERQQLRDYKSRCEKAIEDIQFCLKSIYQEKGMSTDERTRNEMESCIQIFKETLKNLQGSDDK